MMLDLEITETMSYPRIADRSTVACYKCLDVGWQVSPQGSVQRCPSMILDADGHPPLSAAGARISKTVDWMRSNTVPVDSYFFEIARTLASATADRPMHRDVLIENHFSYVRGPENQRRKLTEAVRHLLEVWLLPVGSSKRKPYGYWIITDEADFRDWFARAIAEPVTRIRTLKRLAKVNFPIFAGQMEFDFPEVSE